MLVAVVGPSGAGKDSLIDYARVRLRSEPAILFVRRVVTRPAAANTEDHATMTADEFAAADRAGGFAVNWEAHGLRYGLPMGAKHHVDGGGVAVANGSRAALPSIQASFPGMLVVKVTARADILAQRLAARGRETDGAIAGRLTRATHIPAFRCDVEIDNSGPLPEAGEALIGVLRSCLSVREERLTQ